MKTHGSRTGLFFLILVAAAVCLAFKSPDRPMLPNFDKRDAAKQPGGQASAQQQAAAARLGSVLPGAKVSFYELIGSPRMVAAESGFLTGPNGIGKAVSPATAAAFANDPHGATKAFLSEHSGLFGFGPEALDKARVKSEFTTTYNGLRTVVWEQQVNGIPVFGATLVSHTTKNGELVSVSSQFVPDPESAAKPQADLIVAPPVSATQAIALAAGNIGEALDPGQVQPEPGANPAVQPGEKLEFRAPGLNGNTEAKLIWLPMNKDLLRLCWDLILTSRSRGEMFRVLVDAQTGEVLFRQCLTAYISDITLRVYTNDSPSPFSPGWSTPNSGQPPLVPRTLLTFPALDTNASPAGWINDGVNETLGNNVDAHTDRDNNNQPDLPRPHGSPNRVFDFTLDLTQQPTTYTNGSVVQLFYWNNFMHDKLYELGFTEAAGNFQTANFGRGGVGNDAVQADAQDGGGFNNANFSTPPDGSPGRMQMYIFNGMSPNRDGDLDAQVVLHEYTHGLSWRLVHGGQQLGTIQSDGMGEGWSDFYALCMLSDASEDINGTFAAGAYASYLIGGSTDNQNYYFGIRRYPYTTDMTKNPLTFKDIDPAQADYCSSGAPYHTGMFGTCSTTSANEVHNEGEVWCVTLWDARANLINKYGWAVGNQLILQLVTDGMVQSPAQPNFLEARNAIILADEIDTGGANRNELWAAFAKRGMGFSAISPASTTTAGLHESYDMPDDLRINPLLGFVSSGPVGGPFNILSQTYSLTNFGSNSLTWVVNNSATWLTALPGSGTLVPGGPGANVNVSLSAAAYSMPAGIYNTTLFFTNTANGRVQTRPFTLRVGQPDYYTEQFVGNDNLTNTTLTFTPNGSTSYYGLCRDYAAAFPTDPTGGTVVSLTDDSFVQVTLSGASVRLYNTSSSVFYIGSNGYLTMNSGDATYSENYAAHFNHPRISALFHDLNPGTAGTISWKQMTNRVVVTYQNVPQYGAANSNNFQVEWFFDGRIRITRLRMDTTSSIVGLSAGLGVPSGFSPSDFSSFASCSGALALSLPASATEGDGVLSGAGRVRLPYAQLTNVTVTLTSSDTTEATVPSNLTIPAGQTNGTFDITIVDDAILDGTQASTITASAFGLTAAATNIMVYDNETATLGVLLPATVIEGQGTAPGQVTLSAQAGDNVSVALTSSDITEIQVPPVVVIPAGQTSAVFTATIIDDTIIKDPQHVTVTAHVQNWTDGTANVTVFDNESRNITVALPASATEGNGVLLNAGRVQLAGTVPSGLLVSLYSSNLTEVIVPASVTVPAGQSSALFNVTIVHNPQITGDQTVWVGATAPAFTNGAASMIVHDYETPVVPSSPSPANLAMNVAATGTTLSWTGGTGDVTNDVYFGTSPVPGPADLLGSTTTAYWPLPLLAPNTTCYWQIVSHRGGTTAGPIWSFTTRGLHHFAWAPIVSPATSSVPFAVSLTAADELGRAISNYAGSATLSGLAGTSSVPISPVVSGPFLNGVWSGTVTVLQGADSMMLRADDGQGHVGNSAAFVVGTPGGVYRFVWDPVPTPQQAGVPFAVSLSAQDAFGNPGTNFNGIVGLSATGQVMTPFTMLGNPPGTPQDVSADATLGQTFTPSVDILVTHVRHYFGTKVSIWTADGTLLATKNVTSTPGVWTETALDTPLQLTAGTQYLVSCYSGGVDYFYQTSLGGTFPHGTIDQAYFTSGDAFPTLASGARWWYVDFKYGVPAPNPVALTPTTSGNFANGRWTGALTALQAGSHVVISAADGNGHTGSSSPFDALANPVTISGSGAALIAENCAPFNGVLDPGETVSVAFGLQNLGTATASNVVATLLASGGVAQSSAPVKYGDLNPGAPAVSNVFTFQVAAPCGGTVTATLQVQYGTNDIAIATYSFPVGAPRTPLSENFDAVSPPGLPAGWSAAALGTTPWRTVAGAGDSGTAAVFAGDPPNASDNQLISPPFLIHSATAQISFRHLFATQTCCDGGRLEISVDDGPFVDILAAGGSFATGGYNAGTWWAGSSIGFLTTIANLPAAVVGHTVRFNWHFTSDATISASGWYVDSVLVNDGIACCVTDDLSVAASASPDPAPVGNYLNYVISVANSGPHQANAVVVTNYLPPQVAFISASASQGTWTQNGNTLVWSVGQLTTAASPVMDIQTIPTSGGILTNLAVVTGDHPDANPDNDRILTATLPSLPAGGISTNRFLAPQRITIPDSGPASPYPSSFLVSGLAGTVFKATASLNFITHTFASDIDVLLVGPSGTNVILMANAGGGYGLSSVTLTLDDAAAQPLPTTQIISGTYRPTAYSPPPLWPSPAPAGPYGTVLAGFNGTNPNGSWQLYVLDDTAGDSGYIAQGWTLTLLTSNSIPPKPLILPPAVSPGQIQFSFFSVPGFTYYVEYATDLANPVWLNLRTIPGDGTFATVVDPVTGSQRFYRIRSQ